MAFTDINSEDWLVQKTFADHLHDVLGWEGVYAFNDGTFGPGGTLGCTDTREVVLMRDMRAAISLARCSSTTRSFTGSSSSKARRR